MSNGRRWIPANFFFYSASGIQLSTKGSLAGCLLDHQPASARGRSTEEANAQRSAFSATSAAKTEKPLDQTLNPPTPRLRRGGLNAQPSMAEEGNAERRTRLRRGFGEAIGLTSKWKYGNR